MSLLNVRYVLKPPWNIFPPKLPKRKNLNLIKKSPHNFNIILLNIRSVRNKISLLDDLLCALKADIAVICEHWLNSDEIKTLKFINYHVVSYFCRDNTGYGKVMILCKQTITIKNVEIPNGQIYCFECCGASVKLDKQK